MLVDVIGRGSASTDCCEGVSVAVPGLVGEGVDDSLLIGANVGDV